MAVGDGTTWDETTPTDATTAVSIDDYNRDLRLGVRGRMGIEHEWPSSQSATSEAGKHKFMTFQTQGAAPTLAGTQNGSIYLGTDSVMRVATPLVAAMPVPRIVQIVNVMDAAVDDGNTTTPFDDTIPQISEGNEFMTLAITPTVATNKLKIDVVFNYSWTNNTALTVALFEGTTANAIACVGDEMEGNQAAIHPMRTRTFTHYMTAGAITELTFRVRAGTVSGAVTFNGDAASRVYGGVCASSITITEIGV